MTSAPDTMRVFVPLTIKRQNGRPRILPPSDLDRADRDPTAADRRLLRALARAWDWRRQLERGQAATLTDIAEAEGVTVAFISRFLRLAYLSPLVLEHLLVRRRPCALSLEQLTLVALAPWSEQPARVFEE
ncbi:hypothetical protein [Oleisolibacter albus]|uniref:hypothetical protein n=1 Tax=Oleisolibacter albus TaxID=2171757 RepID=UPI000DF38A76|nr:hypothetical protein [Oleisolibacter albus]